MQEREEGEQKEKGRKEPGQVFARSAAANWQVLRVFTPIS